MNYKINRLKTSSNEKDSINRQSDMSDYQQSITYTQVNPSIKSRYKHQILKPTPRSKNHQIRQDYYISDGTFSQYGTNYRQKNQPSFGKKNKNNNNQIQTRYKSIQKLLENQNRNLKQQNNLLLSQIKKISLKQQKFRQLYQNCKQDLRQMTLERNAYRQQTQQLKSIAHYDIKKLEKKLKRAVNDDDIQSIAQSQDYQRAIKIDRRKIPQDFTDFTNAETLE